MTQPKIILTDDISGNLLSELDRREIALWFRGIPTDAATQEELLLFLGLPWRMVLLEESEPSLINALNARPAANDPMVRKRGFIEIIDSDPSRIELPQRCLPIYLLNGAHQINQEDFQSRFRRMAMLEVLRRSGVRHVLVVAGSKNPLPPDLSELWSSGFRSSLTFATDVADAAVALEAGIKEFDTLHAVALFRSSTGQVVANILRRYTETYPEEQVVIRIRNRSGDFSTFDITGLDDPERPLLDRYSIIEERHLSTLTPDQLSEEEFVSFFKNSADSWRPYAAGLPWKRDEQSNEKLRKLLKNLDIGGSEENCIAYLMAESGAGGTTTARMLAWEFACQGYPVLVAKALPFTPDALSVANLLNRIKLEYEALGRHGASSDEEQIPPIRNVGKNGKEESPPASSEARYEVPWIILFDRVHWEYRDTELRRFRNEMEKQGRPVCILVVSGPIRELAYFDKSTFKQVGELNHALDQGEARSLGRHLNQFLRIYGKAREEWQWDQFHQEHTIRYLGGISAFWVTLSFWIQAQYDLSESIQEWMYRSFKEKADEGLIQAAILEVAAMSTERLPMPEALLPRSQGKWPVSHLLEDRRSSLGPLGLVHISGAGEKYWALAHDILGRFLINALFYDFPKRDSMGLGAAKDQEHLRFLLLKKISQKPELGQIAYRDIGDDFATSIFKIDPDHGRATFAPFWREVLNGLDTMARPLQDASRVFRHHRAISRRRIAKLNEPLYGVTAHDRIELLTKAIEDIRYALGSIDYTPGSEPNLNLYNSLAHALHDLAEAEEARGANPKIVSDLRDQANDATRRAYAENPTNSFVIETFVRDLLAKARSIPGTAIECCVEALVILFSAISSNEESYRRAQLGDLADKALSILFKHTPKAEAIGEPTGPLDVLTKAWVILAHSVDYGSGTALSDLPEQNRIDAIEMLGHPAGRGNMQVIRLSYDLMCITYPYDFKRQLEYLEQLQSADYHATPQLRLEYGIILYQTNRPVEADRIFRGLRKLWRESEQFVAVPSRLRWLRESGDKSVKTVQATMGSDRELRAMARVLEFQNLLVPFRSEEFGLRDPRPGTRFSCRVSFSHNGPFLRPVTARTT